MFQVPRCTLLTRPVVHEAAMICGAMAAAVLAGIINHPPDSQFILISECLSAVANQLVSCDSFYPRGFPYFYLGTGYFEGVYANFMVFLFFIITTVFLNHHYCQ